MVAAAARIRPEHIYDVGHGATLNSGGLLRYFTKVRLTLFWTIAVSVVGVCGCENSKTATAEPTTPVAPTPTSSAAPASHGQFPDLEKFTEVDWRPFDLGGRPGPGFLIRFGGPGGFDSRPGEARMGMPLAAKVAVARRSRTRKPLSPGRS